MAKLFDIQDTTVAISDLTLTTTHGEVTHNGNISVMGDILSNNDLTVSGTLTVDTINVANLIRQNSNSSDSGQWVGSAESDINGKGLSWTCDTVQNQLIYRTGGRFWSSADFDLKAGAKYNIDNVPVLSAGTLGPSIKTSSLSRVGTLVSLNVSGDVEIGDFAYFNSTFNRLGLGTNEPIAAINIIDNNVNIVLGSPDYDLAEFGTNSNHDLALVTDKQTRILIKNSGEVDINGDLNINGTLTATSVVTDNRVDRTHPLQFSATKDTGLFGLGLLWSSSSSIHQFILTPNPTKFSSSETIDLAADKTYSIEGQTVLSLTQLGSSVTSSYLTQLGTLQSLTVDGQANFNSLTAANINVSGISIQGSTITTQNEYTVNAGSAELFYGDNKQINIGDISLQSKPVKVFGNLSVNIQNPDPNLSFSVAGDVSIGNKKFTNADSYPTSGNYSVGDICWNTKPQAHNYVGWVCVTTGSPGTWLGFGQIANQ